MIHYLSKAKHITCSAKDGKRLSPVRSLAYDSGLALHDRERDKDFSQKHNDGTEIISTEICNYQDCKYTDKSVPIEKRLSDIANDLYDQNRSLKERLLVKFVFALPSGLNDKQLIFLTRKIGEIYSQQFNRPIILAIHKKRRNGVLNCHCHMSIPERALDKDDNWKQKRTKIYMDTNGNLIRDKQYYDADTGWDIRRPIIDMSLVPRDKDGKIKEDEIYARDSVTGNYIYQQREVGNRRKWDCKTHMGKWLENNDIVQMHDNLDFVMNEFFRENNIDDRVVRRDKEATSLLKKAGIRYGKIGPNASTEYKNKVLQTNARYNAYADAIEEALIKERALSAEAELAEHMGRQSTRTINNLHVQEMQLQEKLAKMGKENPIPAYVNNVLRPPKMFMDEAVAEYRKYQSVKRKIAQPLLDSLDLGVRSAQSEILGINNNADATERDRARAKFLEKNVSIMKGLRSAVSDLSQTDFGKKARSNASAKWHRLSKWARYYYVKSRCGKKDTRIYQAYLQLGSNLPPNEKKSVPEPLPLPDTKTLKTKSKIVANAWSKSTQSADHTPPTDITILSELVSTEATITEMLPEEIFTMPSAKEYSRQITDNRHQYEAELAEIAHREAETERQRQEAERKRLAEEATATRRVAGINYPNQSAETSTRWVSASGSSTSPKILTEQELQTAIEQYNKLADARDAEKRARMNELIRIRFSKEKEELEINRYKYIITHQRDSGYQEPPLVTEDWYIEEQTKYYTKHQILFQKHCEDYGIDLSQYHYYKGEAQKIQKSINASYEANKRQKRPIRKQKTTGTEHTQTITRQRDAR